MVPLLRKRESVNLGPPSVLAGASGSSKSHCCFNNERDVQRLRDAESGTRGTVEGSAVGKESSDSPLGPAHGV